MGLTNITDTTLNDNVDTTLNDNVDTDPKPSEEDVKSIKEHVDTPIKNDVGFRNNLLDSGFLTEDINQAYGYVGSSDEIVELEKFDHDEFQNLKARYAQNHPGANSDFRRKQFVKSLIKYLQETRYPDINYEDLKAGTGPFFDRKFRAGDGSTFIPSEKFSKDSLKLSDKAIVSMLTNVEDPTFAKGVIKEVLPGLAGAGGFYYGAKKGAQAYGIPGLFVGGFLGGGGSYFLADEIQHAVTNPPPLGFADTGYEAGRTVSLFATGSWLPWKFPKTVDFGGMSVIENLAKDAPETFSLKARRFLEKMLMGVRQRADEKPIRTGIEEGIITLSSGAAAYGIHAQDPYNPWSRIASELGGAFGSAVTVSLAGSTFRYGDDILKSINALGLKERKIKEIMDKIPGGEDQYSRANPYEYSEIVARVEKEVERELASKGILGKRFGNFWKGAAPAGKYTFKRIKTERLRKAFKTLYQERKNYEEKRRNKGISVEGLEELDREFTTEIFPPLIENIKTALKAHEKRLPKQETTKTKIMGVDIETSSPKVAEEEPPFPSLASASDDEFFRIMERKFVPDSVFPQTQADYEYAKTMIKGLTFLGKAEGNATFLQQAAEIKKHMLLNLMMKKTQHNVDNVMEALSKLTKGEYEENSAEQLGQALLKTIGKQIELSAHEESLLWNLVKRTGRGDIPIPFDSPEDLKVMKLLYRPEEIGTTDGGEKVLFKYFASDDLENNLNSTQTELGGNVFKIIRQWGIRYDLDPIAERVKKQRGGGGEREPGLDLLEENISASKARINNQIRALDETNEKAFRVGGGHELDDLQPFLEINSNTSDIAIVEAEILLKTADLDNRLARIKAGDEWMKYGGDPEVNVIPIIKREIKVLERHLKKLNLEKEIEDFDTGRNQGKVFDSYQKSFEELGILSDDAISPIPKSSDMTLENLIEIYSSARKEARVHKSRGNQNAKRRLNNIANAAFEDIQRLKETDFVDKYGIEAMEVLDAFTNAVSYTSTRANWLNKTFVHELTARKQDGQLVHHPESILFDVFSGRGDSATRKIKQLKTAHTSMINNMQENFPASLKDEEFYKAIEKSQEIGDDTNAILDDMLRHLSGTKANPLIDELFSIKPDGVPSLNFTNYRNFVANNTTDSNDGFLDIFPKVKQDLLEFDKAYVLLSQANKRLNAQSQDLINNKSWAIVTRERYEAPEMAIAKILSGPTPKKDLEEILEIFKNAENDLQRQAPDLLDEASSGEFIVTTPKTPERIGVDVQAYGLTREILNQGKAAFFSSILDYAIKQGSSIKNADDFDPEVVYNLLFRTPKTALGAATEQADDAWTLAKFVLDNDLLPENVRKVSASSTSKKVKELTERDFEIELEEWKAAVETWRNEGKSGPPPARPKKEAEAAEQIISPERQIAFLEEQLANMVRLKKAIESKNVDNLDIDAFLGTQSVFSEFYLSLAGSATGTKLLSLFPGDMGTGAIIAAGKGSKFMNRLVDQIPRELRTTALTELLQRPDLFVRYYEELAIRDRSGKVIGMKDVDQITLMGSIYNFLVEKGLIAPSDKIIRGARTLPIHVEEEVKQQIRDKNLFEKEEPKPVSLAPNTQDTWLAARGTAPTAPTAPPPQPPPPPPTGTANPNQRSMYANLFPNDFASGMINPQGGIKSLLG